MADRQLLPPPAYCPPNPDHYLNRDRETIAELKERIEKMQYLNRKADNYKLRTENRNIEDEKFRLTHRLQQENEDKTQEIIRLNNQLSNIEDKYREEISKYLQEFEDYKNGLNKNHNLEVDNLKFQIKELDNELNMYKEFKENKNKIDEELDRLRQEREDLSKQLKLQQNKLEQNFRKQLEDERNKYQREMKDYDALARKNARDQLKKEELEIFESKERLANDLNMQRTEVENIKREKIRIYEEKRQLIRDLELAENQMQECASKQSEMSKTIKLLKEKIKVMEQTLTSVSTEASKEKEMLIFEFSQKLKERDEELQSNFYLDLRQQVRMRSKEIKNLRSLSQMILDQRSDVEQFFLEALEQIREEVKKRVQAEGKVRRLPSINQKGQVYSDKVELSDLDWEDRERVLRLLFAKMNMGMPPPNWREN